MKENVFMSVAGVNSHIRITHKKKLSLNIDAGPIIGSFQPHYGPGVDSASDRSKVKQSC